MASSSTFPLPDLTYKSAEHHRTSVYLRSIPVHFIVYVLSSLYKLCESWHATACLGRPQRWSPRPNGCWSRLWMASSFISERLCLYIVCLCEKVFGQTLSVTHDRIRFVWILQVLKILVGQLNLEGFYIERLGHHSAFTKENWFLPIISLRLSSLVVPMMGAVTFFALQAKATWAIFTPFFSASSLTLEAESR